jgi:hypothetical protein
MARCGERERTAAAIKQCGTHRAFKPLNAASDGGLGAIQFPRRRTYGTQIRNGDKGTDVVYFHTAY